MVQTAKPLHAPIICAHPSLTFSLMPCYNLVHEEWAFSLTLYWCGAVGSLTSGVYGFDRLSVYVYHKLFNITHHNQVLLLCWWCSKMWKTFNTQIVEIDTDNSLTSEWRLWYNLLQPSRSCPFPKCAHSFFSSGACTQSQNISTDPSICDMFFSTNGIITEQTSDFLELLASLVFWSFFITKRVSCCVTCGLCRAITEGIVAFMWGCHVLDLLSVCAICSCVWFCFGLVLVLCLIFPFLDLEFPSLR